MGSAANVMNWQSLLAQVVMMTIASMIAKKFQTREKAAAWFDSLELDWIAGIGLALGIVCSVCLLPVVLHLIGCI